MESLKNQDDKWFYHTLLVGLQNKKTNGIYIPHNKNGKASGEAFVNFETVEDCSQALERNMNKLGHRYVCHSKQV